MIHKEHARRLDRQATTQASPGPSPRRLARGPSKLAANAPVTAAEPDNACLRDNILQPLSARDNVAHSIGTLDREYQRKRPRIPDLRYENFELTFRARESRRIGVKLAAQVSQRHELPAAKAAPRQTTYDRGEREVIEETGRIPQEKFVMRLRPFMDP